MSPKQLDSINVSPGTDLQLWLLTPGTYCILCRSHRLRATRTLLLSVGIMHVIIYTVSEYSGFTSDQCKCISCWTLLVVTNQCFNTCGLKGEPVAVAALNLFVTGISPLNKTLFPLNKLYKYHCGETHSFTACGIFPPPSHWCWNPVIKCLFVCIWFCLAVGCAAGLFITRWHLKHTPRERYWAGLSAPLWGLYSVLLTLEFLACHLMNIKARGTRPSRKPSHALEDCRPLKTQLFVLSFIHSLHGWLDFS